MHCRLTRLVARHRECWCHLAVTTSYGGSLLILFRCSCRVAVLFIDTGLVIVLKVTVTTFNIILSCCIHYADVDCLFIRYAWDASTIREVSWSVLWSNCWWVWKFEQLRSKFSLALILLYIMHVLLRLICHFNTRSTLLFTSVNPCATDTFCHAMTILFLFGLVSVE